MIWTAACFCQLTDSLAVSAAFKDASILNIAISSCMNRQHIAAIPPLAVTAAALPV